MQVTLVTQWFPPEKAAIPEDIARGLVAQGHQVTVVTGFPNYPGGQVYDGWSQRPVLRSRQDGYELRRVALYPSHDRSPVRRAANYASFGASSTVLAATALLRADVVYVYHPPLTSALGPWLAQRAAGVPYVLHVQDLWPDSVVAAGLLSSRTARTAGRALTPLCDAAYRRAGAVACIAPTMARLLQERGVPEHRLHVIPNWADEQHFRPVPRDEAVVRALGLGGTFNVMFAGNVGPVQGLEVAVHAAAQLQDVPDFRLVIVGDGLAVPRLRALAETVAPRNVLFLGQQPLERMAEITAAADVQLVMLRDLPFLRGTIPSKLGTVLATGLPVVCAVNGDASDVVAAAGAGWTCPAEDVAAVAGAFRAAHAAGASELSRLGASGRSYYLAQLSRESAVSRIAALLADVARGR